MMSLKLDDLDPDTLAKLGIKKPKEKGEKFTAEQERQHAIACMNQIRSLTQAQRGRVLRRALKMNGV